MTTAGFSRRGFLGTSAAAVVTAALTGAGQAPAAIAASPAVGAASPLSKETYRLAAVQAEPIWYDMEATADKTITLMAEAKNNGADVVAFGETWLPGYPIFMWFGDEAYKAPLRDLYLRNSVVKGGSLHRRLEKATKDLGLTLVIGVSERADTKMYIGTWVIDHGTTVHTQRKLKPSGPEWDLFHSGQQGTYKIPATSVGALGALSCNENRRPLLRDKMYTMGEQIHVSAWPCFALDVGIYGMSHLTSLESSAQYAAEGGVTTLAPTLIASEGYHLKYPLPSGGKEALKPGGGYAMIFDRDGKRVADPLDPTTEGIVYADVSSSAILGPNNYDEKPFVVRQNGLQ